MTKVIVGMTMSLDGYIQDENGSVEKLYTDFGELHDAPSFQKMIEDTGAVVMGRHTYEMADPLTWVNETYEFQVPLFILTHTVPASEKIPKGNEKLCVNFVTDGVASAVSAAKKAAGEKMVQIIGGPNTIQQCINARLCDELWIDVMPVILGKGLRLFENIEVGEIKLERISIEIPTAARTSMKFKL